jgi:hypothetical protein
MPSISFIIGFVTFLIVKSALPTLAQFEGDHINTGPNHSVAFIQDTETGAQREAEAAACVYRSSLETEWNATFTKRVGDSRKA